jgi:hypothetical protein
MEVDGTQADAECPCGLLAGGATNNLSQRHTFFVKVSWPENGFDKTSSAPFSLLISCLARLSRESPKTPNRLSVARWSIGAHAPHQAYRRFCSPATNRCRARSFSGPREIDRVFARTRRTPSNVSFLARTRFRSPSSHHSLWPELSFASQPPVMRWGSNSSPLRYQSVPASNSICPRRPIAVKARNGATQGLLRLL